MPKYQIRCSIPCEKIHTIEQALEGYGESLSIFEDMDSPPSDHLDNNGFPIASLFYLDIICQDKDVKTCLSHLEAAASLLATAINPLVTPVETTNWHTEHHKNQPVIHVSPFIIHSSYYQENIPKGTIPLIINAATAFGSGEHPTTQGCLKLFIALNKEKRFETICDMGCGSGILSIAAKKLQPWLKVIAVDIEKEAVEHTAWNAKLNHCNNQFHALPSVGFKNPSTHNTYDLCFANILAKPLVLLAPSMQRYIKKSGYVIASGLLDAQAPMVINAYRHNRFFLEKSISINGWQSLLFKRLE